MFDRSRPLPLLLQDLRDLARTIRRFAQQARYSEEEQACRDYVGVLCEVCRALNLDYRRVYHPLLGPADMAPTGIRLIYY